MGKIKEMNIKNRTYYFFNNIINIEGLDVSCKSQNHPQTSQTSNKPAKPPTNHPNHPQTIHKLAKLPTNQPQTYQSTHKISTNIQL